MSAPTHKNAIHRISTVTFGPSTDSTNNIPSLWQLVTSQSYSTEQVRSYPFDGHGTAENPYCVTWIPNDPRNPFLMPYTYKAVISLIQVISLFSVTFASSALSAAGPQIQEAFHASSTLTIADTALFILAFGIGPVLWGPLSELYGRQVIFAATFALCVLFSGLTIASDSLPMLIALRFLAAAFGSSAITNSGGVAADIFVARDRGLGMLIFVTPAFVGPSIGPIACSHLAVAAGWKWVQSLTTIMITVSFVLGLVLMPETYHPVLLQRRAVKLSKLTGKLYKSKLEIECGTTDVGAVFRKAMIRPFALLFREPIMMCIAGYMAIIYGTLYMEFAAFPIVFQGARRWSQANSGLAFVGMATGQMLGMLYTAIDNKRYQRLVDNSSGLGAPPESRLPPSMVGSILLPIGLFLFAWTNSPNIPWIVCELGTVLLGFSHVAIFLSAANYQIDTYTIYAASSLAANTVTRAFVGAAFPLFTNTMYSHLGIHWGSSVPAFLALACTPMPWLFYLYGPTIRRKCKYAAESAQLTEHLKKHATAIVIREREKQDTSDAEAVHVISK